MPTKTITEEQNVAGERTVKTIPAQMTMADSGEPVGTVWRWECPEGHISVCTFENEDDALHYGRIHARRHQQ